MAKRGRPKKKPRIDSDDDEEEEEQRMSETDEEPKQVETDERNDGEGTSAELKENLTETKMGSGKEEEDSIVAEVDSECQELAGKVHVYVDAKTGHCYDVMLNQVGVLGFVLLKYPIFCRRIFSKTTTNST